MDNVSLSIKEGSVHVILGENGAGKSTLMKILAGVIKPDSGEIFIRGKKIELSSPMDALNLGIGMVYQELTLVPSLSVFENICLGNLPQKGKSFIVDWENARKRARDVLVRLGADEIKLDQKVRNLNVGQQQLVEIARAISRDVRLVILDEPTSALTNNEREKLFTAIKALKKEGVSFIYISHRLEEIPMIGDEVSVLRDGKVIDTKTVGEVDEQTLINMMIGRTLEEQFPKEEVAKGGAVLRVEELQSGKEVQDVTFEVKKGEVLGIAGLIGSGRTELLEAIFGLRRIDKGRIYLNGKEFKPGSPVDAIRSGIALITKDRKNSLALQLSVEKNLTLASLDKYSSFGVVNKYKETSEAATLIKELKIEPPELSRALKTFSGGNQQKVALGKWLCSQANIFLMDEPTRGIDVGAKVEVYRLINNLTTNGAAVVMVSSEIPELLGMSDRIIVMRSGRVCAEFVRENASQEAILRAALGGSVA
nr:sugar ABC transporter ATP-binding protein [Moorella sulfitireducens]